MEELIELEERFQPHLLNNDYTFIGPANMDLFEGFTRNVNLLAPVVAPARTIHHALSHRQSVRRALLNLPPGTDLRIYVVIRENDTILFHATIGDYCERFGIDFDI